MQGAGEKENIRLMLPSIIFWYSFYFWKHIDLLFKKKHWINNKGKKKKPQIESKLKQMNLIVSQMKIIATLKGKK